MSPAPLCLTHSNPTPFCLGLVTTLLANPSLSALSTLTEDQKTHWVSLRSHSHQLLVYIPSLTDPIGVIPPPLNTIILPRMNGPTSFGPAGGWKSSVPSNNTIFIEAVLQSQSSTRLTNFHVALTIFTMERLVNPLYQDLLEARILPHRPHNYQPHQHSGCPLAHLPPLSPLQLDQIIIPSFDPQLLSVPSGRDLKPYHPPRDVILTTLLEYQAQGLAFLLDRESDNSQSAHALWNKTETPLGILCTHKISQVGVLTQSPSEIPQGPRGSILADDMGLGKSIQAISLIGSTLSLSQQFIHAPPLPNAPLPRLQSTLVICPARLIFNWENELKKHTNPIPVPFIKYHGRNRKLISPQIIRSCQVILTTYPIAQYEFTHQRHESLLFRHHWFRVVLDEAHAIRTAESKTQEALMAISSERRLCLTGTPVQNNIHDILSLLSFLCCNLPTPHNQWPDLLIPYLSKGEMKPLQLILRHAMLRRLKHSVLTNLPPITHQDIIIPLSPLIQDYYDEQFNLFLASIGSSSRCSNNKFFQYLHKLRGICDHPLLADPSKNFNEDTSNPSPTAPPPPQTKGETVTFFISRSTPFQSTKIEKLISILQSSTTNNQKAVIYSTWTRYLDIIGIALEVHQIKFLRLDGRLNAKEQDQRLSQFHSSQDEMVLLASEQTAGVGLNITCASIAIIMEPHWNPTVEAQAVDRLHRIGQSRTVQVIHFITPNTIEEKIQIIQRRKKQLAE